MDTNIDNRGNDLKGVDLIPKSSISVEDLISFFKYQHEQFLLETQSGCNTNLNFVSNSGVVVSAHQALLFPRSQYLQSLMDPGDACGCSHDAPTLLLPDFDHKVIKALVNLLYSGSAVVTSGEKDELLRLMRVLRIEISEDQLITDSPSLSNNSHENRSEQATVTEILLASAKQIETSFSLEGNGLMEKNDWTKRNKTDNVKCEELGPEQKKIMEELRYMLDILQSMNIKNDQFFIKVQKPMDDHLLSSVKFLPMEPTINVLPTEIKTRILKYLCDSGTLVAATICQEWRDIVNDRLAKMESVNIQSYCSNVYSCEEGKCYMPEEILLAPKILNLDVEFNLYSHSPLTSVDPKVIAEGLTSVSRFIITSDHQNQPALSENQISYLFDTMGQKNKTFNYVKLLGVNMSHLNQDKLINSLLKVKKLALHQRIGEPQLDVKKFIQKILEDTTESKIKFLSMAYWEYPENMSVEFADALSKIKSVSFGFNTQLTAVSTQRLIDNILARPITLNDLRIFRQVDWRDLISPENLNILISKLVKIILRGRFTQQQLETARVLPGVIVKRSGGLDIIKKAL